MKEILKSVFLNHWNSDFIIDSLQDKKLSYKDFFSIVLNCANKLGELGLQKNDKICLIMNNSLDLVVIYFACLLKQLVAIPIDPNKGKEDIKNILGLVNSKIVFFENVSNSEFCDICVNALNIGLIKNDFYIKNELGKDDLSLFDEVDFNKLYLITFTSGSTGIPKGVMHSFNNLINSAIAFNKRFNFDENNIFYHNLPMTYMAGILNLLILPLISGSKIILGSRFDISKIVNFWDVPIKYDVNTFWFVPSILSLLLKFDRGNKGIDYLSCINAIGCVGTAPLDVQVKKRFEEKYRIFLYESYGLSETLFLTTNFKSYDQTRSVGKPLDNVEIRFAEDGEILIRVPWMFLGYFSLEKEQNIESKIFKTGDIGEFTENGFLSIKDRKKDLIIRGGINISPAKLNSFINETVLFEESIVLGLPDEVMGEKNVCFFIPKKQPQADFKRELNLRILQKLGKDYCIDEFWEIKDIPKNLNGKIDKLKLKSLYSKLSL